MGYLFKSIDDSYLIQKVNRRAETCDGMNKRKKLARTSMHTPNHIINHTTEDKVVKKIGKVRPDVGIPVFPNAFCVKSVRLIDSI